MASDESQVDALIAELASLLRARHASTLDQLELPTLGRLVTREGMAVSELVLAAVERIGDPRTRHAARELVPMPFGSRIAPTLTDRRIAAARSFGQSGNYFRSGPADRSKPSTESLVLTAIATALSAAAVESAGRPSADPVVPQHPLGARSSPERAKPVGPQQPPVDARRDRGAGAWASLAASLILLVPVIWAVADRATDRVAPAEDPRPSSAGRGLHGCRHQLGTGSGYLRTGFRTALREARVEQRCPVEGVQTFEDMAFQRIAEDDAEETWAVLERPDGSFLVLPWTAWERYRTVAEAGIGLDGSGLPAAWRKVGSRGELILDSGLTIASERPHGLYFLVHPDVDRLWRVRSDELGAPYSSGMTTRRQDFAGGYVQLDGDEVVWVAVSNAAAKRALPPPEDRREATIAQPSGIAWWVDATDRRWSIRSEQVKACLGGQEAIVDETVPGYAVAQLEYAGVADCSLAPG